MRRAAFLCVLAALVVACGGGGKKTSGEILVVVNVPLAKGGSVAKQIERGAIVAAERVNAAGGVKVGEKRMSVRIDTVDSDYSPVRSADNVRDAVRDGATAIIDEGTGVDAEWQVAPNLPIAIVVQGGASLVDPAKRRNVFRVAPTNRGVAFRTAEYLVPKGVKLAIIHDDSVYGTGGAQALGRAFGSSPGAVTKTIRVPAGASDLAPDVLQARKSGATGLLIWARAPIVALAVRAARQAEWNVPLYGATSAEDPLVRQQLADRPSWIEGFTFTTSRLTAERGPAAYEAFRAAYEKKFGVEKIGVKWSGKDVVQPPTWAMYSYDFVLVLANAITRAGLATPGPRLIDALEQAVAEGANGDLRGFTKTNHEGVVDDDVYFARIEAMQFVPVRDDALSKTLPPVRQTV